MNTETKIDMGLGDVSTLSYFEQENVLSNYIHSLLFGELDEYLHKNDVKLFKGISREFAKKYMIGFNRMLKLNGYTTGPMDDGFEIDYNGEVATEFVGFFVFQNGRGHVFGSFQYAYKHANETYMFDHMIVGNATIQLAKNTQVSFGRVIVQNGSMVEKDLEEMVNNDFYKALIT